MGIMDFIMGGPDDKKIEGLKKRGKVTELISFLDSSDVRSRQLAIDALSELALSEHIREEDRQEAIDILDPINRMREKIRIHEIDDYKKVRSLALNEYFAEKDYEMAIYALEKALEKSPHDYSTLNSLAAAYLLNDQFNEARKIWESILAEKPNDAEAVENYVNALYKRAKKIMGNKKPELETIDMLERALKLQPDNISLMLELGDCYMKIISYEKARSYFLKALETSQVPEGFVDMTDFRGRISRKLGDAFMGDGMKEEALPYYRQAMNLCKWEEDDTVKMQNILRGVK